MKVQEEGLSNEYHNVPELRWQLLPNLFVSISKTSIILSR